MIDVHVSSLLHVYLQTHSLYRCIRACTCTYFSDWEQYFTSIQERHNGFLLKRRLSSGMRWKIICERYHCYYANGEEHQINHVPWKAWLFRCLSILSMACNIVKIMGQIFFATCSCSPIYIFLCTVLVTLPRLGQISYHFDDSRTLQYTQILIY